jgi:hypothetical protein
MSQPRPYPQVIGDLSGDLRWMAEMLVKRSHPNERELLVEIRRTAEAVAASAKALEPHLVRNDLPVWTFETVFPPQEAA